MPVRSHAHWFIAASNVTGLKSAVQWKSEVLFRDKHDAIGIALTTQPVPLYVQN
jgi:hypothetical protein